MIKNHLKIAVRQSLKQKMYSAIKVGGFALGIAACLLIGMYIRNELSYDMHYPDADRIARLVGQLKVQDKILGTVSFPAPLSGVVKTDFPEVEKSGRILSTPLFKGAGSNLIKLAGSDQNIYESGFAYADQEILDIFQMPMVYGDRASALAAPRNIVLSRTKSDKFFPGQNPVGKVIYLNNNASEPYTIGGVMEDLPSNTHLQYDFLISLKDHSFWEGEQTNWISSNYAVYVLLQPGIDRVSFAKKLTSVVLNNYMIPAMEDKNRSPEKFKNASLNIQALKDIHLHSSDIDNNMGSGDIRFVWLFGSIACFILMIACINFINLSTARSANRAREVGLRKVVGSFRSTIITQFLTESILFSVISFILGILLAWILNPYFNTLAGKSMFLPWNEWWFIPVMLSAAMVVGLIAGIYPALYLSSFKPSSVLKGDISRGSKNSTLRSGLVVFQFTTSVILIISTIVVYRQMQFILNKKVGYDKEQVMVIQGTNTLGEQTAAFKNELLKIPGVGSVSVSDYLPVDGTKRDSNPFWTDDKTTADPSTQGQFWVTDTDYIRTMGMKLVQGRNFSAEKDANSNSAIINQTLARNLGLTDPIGKRIKNYAATFTVIGVIEDFNFESLRREVGGICLVLGNSPSLMTVKVGKVDMSGVVTSVTALWKAFLPAQPIRFTFLNERYANMYADVQRTGNIFTSFAVFAIIVACLGLFALSAFMAEQRTKEIGIRKVLGASIASINAMLSKDFVKLVLISILIASPIALYLMNKWLQDFAYRIEIEWWMFALAGFAVILIALITVSFQTIRAAIVNPIKSLRTE